MLFQGKMTMSIKMTMNPSYWYSVKFIIFLSDMQLIYRLTHLKKSVYPSI